MKVGDRVRIKNYPQFPKRFWGLEGVIVRNELDTKCFKKQRYYVRLDGVLGDHWFCHGSLYKIEGGLK